MPQWADIEYRDFWDVPRMFVARHDGRPYLFRDPFDSMTENYSHQYEVLELPPLGADELKGSWDGLAGRALTKLGTVRIDEVEFDSSRRRSMDTAIIDKLLEATTSPSKQAG
jgi:hypothetical protein